MFLVSPVHLTITNVFGLSRSEKDNYPDLERFIIDCIKNFSQKVISTSLSKGDIFGLVRYEAMFSREFYRVASALTPINVTISPEACNYLGIEKKAPDYYINDNKKWLVEFLVEGSDLKGHVTRPEQGWEPAFNKGAIKDFIFVDFRPLSRAKNLPTNFSHPDKYLFVVYDDKDFGGASILKYSPEKREHIEISTICFEQ